MRLLFPLLLLIVIAVSGNEAFARKQEPLELGSRYFVPRYTCFQAVTVIDARTDTSIVGLKRAGLKQVELVSPGGLGPLLERYILGLCKAARKGDAALLAVVRELYIDQRAIGFVRVRVDFYFTRGTQQFLCNSVDQVIETPKNVVQELAYFLFLEVQKIAAMNPEKQAAMTPPTTLDSAVNVDRNAKLACPVYQQTAFVRGIYRSVPSFLSGQPDDTAFEQRDYFPGGTGANVPTFYLLDDRQKRADKVTEYFAVFNGTDWYLSTSGGAIRMRFEQQDFYANLVLKGYSSTSDHPMVLGAAFGLIGGLADAIIYESQPDPKHTGLVLYRCRLDPQKRRFAISRRIGE